MLIWRRRARNDARSFYYTLFETNNQKEKAWIGFQWLILNKNWHIILKNARIWCFRKSSMSKKLLIVLITFLLLGSVLVSILVWSKQNQLAANDVILSTQEESQHPSYPQAENFRFITIPELKAMETPEGNYNVEGYVVYRSHCPPCPPGAYCAPCPPSFIVISEDGSQLERAEVKDLIAQPKNLKILILNPQQFEIGKKYVFSLQVSDYRSPYENFNEVALVGYDEI